MNTSWHTAMDNDQTKVTTKGEKEITSIISGSVPEKYDSNKFHSTSRSASLATPNTDGTTDEGSRSTFNLVSERSASLVPGIIDRVIDEGDTSKFSEVSASRAPLIIGASAGAADKSNKDRIPKAARESDSLAVGVTDRGGDDYERKEVNKTSKRSISIETEGTENETHKDQGERFSSASERSTSFAGVITHELGEDFGHDFKQSTSRRASLGSEAAVDKYRHNIFKPEARKVPVSRITPDIHTFETIGRKKNTVSHVHHVSKSSKARSSISIRDPFKVRLEMKRASFQTSVIEGFSISDEKEDDEDEGTTNLWKRMFERKVAKRVLNIQEHKLILLQKRKREKANLVKKVPMDLLVKEWFNENKMTVQTRIYILEKVLPTLILGLENLLIEVEKKHLTLLERPHPYFNPIDFLAQFMMRNNPCYRNIPDKDTYLLGLHHVAQDLKNYTADIKDNRLFCLKLKTKLRQKEREQQEKVNAANQEQRKQNLQVHFRDWMLSTNGIVLLSLAQSVLVSFSEVFSDYLFETFEDVRYDKELEEIDTTGKILNEEEFVEYMYSYVKGFSDGPFADFLVHLSHSSDFFYHKEQNYFWRQQYAELFMECDVGKIGLLKRKKILSLFEDFYDQHSGTHKTKLQNPKEYFLLDFGNDHISTQVHVYSCSEEKISTAQRKAGVTGQTLLPENQTTERDHVKETGDPAYKSWQSLIDSFGDLLPGTHSHEEQEAKLSKFPGLTTYILDLQANRLYLNTSQFKKNFINCLQFVQLMEIFVRNITESSLKQNLINFIWKRYRETKKEKLEKLAQANHEALQKTHRIILDALFEKWDYDVSGYINLKELAEVLSKYKDGTEKNSLKNAHHKLKLYRKYYSDNPTLMKSEFNVYIETIIAEISGKEDDFENLVTYLTARTEQGCIERARHRARRKWFQDIKRAAATSSSSMEAVYKSVFQTLYKDSEAHGGNKKISSSIALLRHNYHRPERGEYFLHYVACTLEDAPFVLNQALYRDMGVSFGAIDEGKPLHIYRVQDHGKVHFWNCHRERTEGSFLVIPVKDQQNRVFGVLGMDTLRDTCEKTFAAHEISFHQGVAKAFSIAYHHVRVRNSILKAVDGALMWLFNVTPNIKTGITYLAEPTTVKDYVLCKTMTSENYLTEKWSDVHAPPMVLKRKDNYFRNYLFSCADTSEVVFSTTYKGRHICVPLRGADGRALAILDIKIDLQHELVAYEYRSLLKMLHILNQTCTMIVKEATEPQGSLASDPDHEYEGREKLLFHQLMLREMSDNVQHLKDLEDGELKSSKDPSPLVHKILKILFHLVKPKVNVEYLSWSQFKEELNSELIQVICSFDPVKTDGNIKTYLLERYFKDIRPDQVWKCGSRTIYYMYHWSYICFTLMQLKSNLKYLYKPPSVCHLAST
ncbi:EF-hand calcium-binding domain-containing protein 5-like isoform X2 [Narcine bancroftii]|uniref:EF-hand calcium-binding domain-containing protein 5-like isoform X2 n=1 Tax=Narcine bancroftii TaxID=1343680 RepID=UPI00383157FB